MNKISKKKQKRKILKNKRKQKRKTIKIVKGGIFGALFGATNSGDEVVKPNADNKSYSMNISKGYFIRTIYNIEYIIPNNFILLKDPNSFFTGRFNVSLNGIKQNCFIQIENPNNGNIKFIDYFVGIKNNNVWDWYCMMRIYGLINTEILATLTNTIFYKLNNFFILYNTNTIQFQQGTYDIVDKNDLNLLQKGPLMKDTGTVIKIKKDQNYYYPVTEGKIYEVLRQFRNTQLINAGVKEEGVKMGVDIAAELIK